MKTGFGWQSTREDQRQECWRRRAQDRRCSRRVLQRRRGGRGTSNALLARVTMSDNVRSVTFRPTLITVSPYHSFARRAKTRTVWSAFGAHG